MRPHTALVFPGQGAYTPGMFADRDDGELTRLLVTVDAVAAEFRRGPISPLLTDRDAPTAAELSGTDPFALQLAFYAGALGGFILLHPDLAGTVLVGHSMGEVAALVAAGAFDATTGARLLSHRALALAEHSPGSGGMISVGLSAERAEGLLRALDEPGVAIAVRNSPRKVAVSGPEPALALLSSAAEALGVRVARLSSPYPFHSSMLARAAHAFAESISGFRQEPLRARVWSPVEGREVTDADDLTALIVRQLTTVVDFLGAVRALHAAGVDSFVETCSGGLAGMVAKTVPIAGGASAPGPADHVGPSALARSATVAGPIGEPAQSTVDQLRTLYATALGYPEEAITADADLEADLGVDSLKRAEMLSKVAVRFGLRRSGWLPRMEDHSTLAELADLVEAGQAASR